MQGFTVGRRSRSSPAARRLRRRPPRSSRARRGHLRCAGAEAERRDPTAAVVAHRRREGLAAGRCRWLDAALETDRLSKRRKSRCVARRRVHDQGRELAERLVVHHRADPSRAKIVLDAPVVGARRHVAEQHARCDATRGHDGSLGPVVRTRRDVVRADEPALAESARHHAADPAQQALAAMIRVDEPTHGLAHDIARDRDASPDVPHHPPARRNRHAGDEPTVQELPTDRLRVVEVGLGIGLAVAAAHAVDQGVDVGLFEPAYAHSMRAFFAHAARVVDPPAHQRDRRRPVEPPC